MYALEAGRGWRDNAPYVILDVFTLRRYRERTRPTNRSRLCRNFFSGAKDLRQPRELRPLASRRRAREETPICSAYHKNFLCSQERGKRLQHLPSYVDEARAAIVQPC